MAEIGFANHYPGRRFPEVPQPVPPLARQLVAAADYGFAILVVFSSSDAFIFLGLSSLQWLLVYAYLFARILFTFRIFGAFVSKNAVFLLYPGLCALSVLWSDIPVETLKFSIQLIVSTFAALFIGMRLSLDEIFTIVMASFLIMMLASLANLHGALSPSIDVRGYFVGIFLSKNSFGHRSVLFVIGCVFLIFLMPRVSIARRAVYLVALGATAYMVSISGSATAMALTVGLGGLSTGLYLVLARRNGLALVLPVVAAVIACGLLATSVLGANPVQAVFDLLGRDPTMTGRTVLWQFGWEIYLTRPWLGFGADGFWVNPIYAGTLANLQAQYGEGLHGFHNLIVELLVTLGPLGLVAHGLAGFVALRRTILLSRQTSDPVAVWAITILLALYGMAMIGPQLFNGHAIAMILLIAIGAAAGKKLDARRLSGRWPREGLSGLAGVKL